MLQEPACNSSMLLLELFEKFPLAYQTKQCFFNLFTPGNFVEKSVLQLVQPFSGHSLAIKSYNVPNSPFQVVQFQMHNISLRSLSMRRNILGVKGHSSLDIFFSPSLLPSSFALLTAFSFFCCACTRLHFGGKWFWGASF